MPVEGLAVVRESFHSELTLHHPIEALLRNEFPVEQRLNEFGQVGRRRDQSARAEGDA